MFRMSGHGHDHDHVHVHDLPRLSRDYGVVAVLAADLL
jgi:hypothetical protein